MIGILTWNSQYWKQILGENLHAQAFQSVTALTLGGTATVVSAALIGARMKAKEDHVNGFSIRQLVGETLHETSTGLKRPTYLLINIGVAALEVWLMIAAFAMSVIPLRAASPNGRIFLEDA